MGGPNYGHFFFFLQLINFILNIVKLTKEDVIVRIEVIR